MKYTVSFFKGKIKAINDRLEQENYSHRLRGQYIMEKGHLKKMAFYSKSVLVFQLLNKQGILTDDLSLKQAEHWLDNFDPKQNGFEVSQVGLPYFPNGFDSWNATHFEIIMAIRPEYNGTHSFIRHLCQGREGLYELAREMTDRFEREHEGRDWDGDMLNNVRDFCRRNNL